MSSFTMPRTAEGDVVEGYGLAELAAGLMKTLSPRESQEKSVAACATVSTAASTVGSDDPRGTAATVTRSVAPESPGDSVGIRVPSV
jgi:hypothetical protein